MQDHRRLVLAGECTHVLSADLLWRGSVCRRPPPAAEKKQIVAPQDEDTLGTDVNEVRAEVTGQSTGYRQTGGFWFARTTDRLVELRRIAAIGEMRTSMRAWWDGTRSRRRLPTCSSPILPARCG